MLIYSILLFVVNFMKRIEQYIYIILSFIYIFLFHIGSLYHIPNSKLLYTL